MTTLDKFNKELFSYHGGYLTYAGKFVARFKYSARDKAGFVSFLTKNFTPYDYFKQIAEGATPVGLLESKGYISKTIKDVLTRNGYEATPEGREAYLNNFVKNW